MICFVESLLIVFKSNERSEGSYIGLADFFVYFFSGKSLYTSIACVIV